jgi:ligand-binding SRPBCC domain-containing protein
MPKEFTHRFRVNASLARVAEFHQDSRVLKILTPFPIIVKFNRVEPLAEGSTADFTMWFGPLPVRWVAVHSNVDPNSGFVDAQMLGPFQSWQHRHTFIAIDTNTTEILDQVQAEPSTHPFWGPISWLMWLTLPVLFAYRALITRRNVERGIS